MDHQLEATERQALEAMRQALQLEALPIDPPGWFSASEMARQWGSSESSVRRALRAKVAGGIVEEMLAVKTMPAGRVRVRLYRPKT